MARTVPALLFCCALVSTLSGAVNSEAVTEVTLSPATNPTSGQPGVGYVSVTGVGFPAGTIAPSGVRVTLTPPSGTAVKVTPVKVKLNSGTTETTTFVIPTSISVTAPTVYTVTLAGQTTTGTKFASSNSSSLTVDPLAQLLSVAPASGVAGTSLSVVLTGGYTHFVQGTTTASFGPGIAVGGGAVGQAGPVTVTSATSATAQIVISATAAAGAQTVLVATGTEQESLVNGFTVTPAPSLISVTPATGVAGTSLSVVLTGANTHFVQGTTTASFGPGIAVGGGAIGQPGPVTVTSSTSATAQIVISATATAGAQTVLVATGTEQESLANAFTITPAPQLLSVTPNTLNAGLSATVTLTGSNTHFVQGTTTASFGPGVAVGGGTEGQPGPVTVNSPTTATAQIAVDPAAVAGAQTVTVATGQETESLTGGFTVGTPVGVINFTTATSQPLAPGFSGAQDSFPLNGVEYYDPKYLAMVEPMKFGSVRFPAGLASMTFDWQTGHENSTWLTELTPEIYSYTVSGLQKSAYLTQAKGGANFSDFTTFIQTLNASGVVVVNGFTDNLPNSYGLFATTAQAAGANIIDWEVDNEPYAYPGVFPTASSYLTSAMPYAQDILTAVPSDTTSVFYEGNYSGFGLGTTWDTGMNAFSPRFWQGVSTHIYPINNASISTVAEEQTLNGFLAYGTNEYFNSYFIPLVGANTPIYITEWNSDGLSTLPFESYQYNAVFVGEFIARMSTVPNVKEMGVSEIYLGNSFNQGMIRAVNDFESYLTSHVIANPNYSTDTATNPNTQFSFYYSTSGLAVTIANQAVNSSDSTWPTTVSSTGIPTVPIIGFNGQPIPAVFAQAYHGTDGTHYVLITNKSNVSVPVGIEINGLLGPASVTASYISSASDTAQNTATNQTAVTIVNTTFQNPLTVGPYSVTRVQW